MKRLLFCWLLIGIGVLFNFSASADGGEKPIPLTHEEEEGLAQLLPQSLRWVAEWNDHSFVCRERGQINWFDNWHALQGRTISIKILRSDKHLEVAIEPLHLAFDFLRLHELGLGPALPVHFCENSIEEFLTRKREFAENMTQSSKETIEHLHSDPRMAPLFEHLNEEAKPFKDSGETIEESREFKMPLMVSPQRRTSTSETQQMLVHLAIAAAQKDVLQMCSPGDRYELIVPEMEVGDPGIYILVKAVKTGEICIEDVYFDRNPSGEYHAFSGKCMDDPEVVALFRGRINSHQPKDGGIIVCKHAAQR